MDRVGTWLDRFGSDTGGMTVRIVGRDAAGESHCLQWELVAEANHGPEIPGMAAVILTTKLKRGGAWKPGAKVCMGLLELSDFQPEFDRWRISTQISPLSLTISDRQFSRPR